MARDIVYFDLETQKSANDVGGWGRKDLMRMSIGVTYSTRLGQYRIFGEHDADDLVDQLRRADLVIGFNHIYFDYEVLQAYTVLNLKEEIPSFDLMMDLEEKLGHRPKLEAVAQPTLGVGKTAEGTQAIRWWREGKILDIARYCAFDVKVTRLVHEFGAAYGLVRYVNRFKQQQEITVHWQHS